jgi:serine/threonine protein kinase
MKSNSEFLENEVEAGRILDHKYVARFVNSHEDKKFVYMVFEFIDGITLYELLSLKEGKPFEEVTATN